MVTLNLDSYHFNTPANLTLNIRNNGALTTALIAYYVKDTSGAQYANSNWPGPTIPPAAVTSINILIDGTAFTFQTGNSYTVSILTSRNYPILIHNYRVSRYIQFNTRVSPAKLAFLLPRFALVEPSRSKFVRLQIALVEGLSHAATHKECGPSDSGEGLRQMWTAGTYLSPIYELHSLRWTPETCQEFALTGGFAGQKRGKLLHNPL